MVHIITSPHLSQTCSYFAFIHTNSNIANLFVLKASAESKGDNKIDYFNTDIISPHALT